MQNTISAQELLLFLNSISTEELGSYTMTTEKTDNNICYGIEISVIPGLIFNCELFIVASPSERVPLTSYRGNIQNFETWKKILTHMEERIPELEKMNRLLEKHEACKNNAKVTTLPSIKNSI